MRQGLDGKTYRLLQVPSKWTILHDSQVLLVSISKRCIVYSCICVLHFSWNNIILYCMHIFKIGKTKKEEKVYTGICFHYKGTFTLQFSEIFFNNVVPCKWFVIMVFYFFAFFLPFLLTSVYIFSITFLKAKSIGFKKIIEIKFVNKSIDSKKKEWKRNKVKPTSQLNKNFIRKNRSSNLFKNKKNKHNREKNKVEIKKVSQLRFYSTFPVSYFPLLYFLSCLINCEHAATM